MASPYPAHRETDVVLRDDSTMHLRPARPEDRTAVEDYLLRLSPESRRLRFWAASLDVGETALSAVEIDHEGHEMLLPCPFRDMGRSWKERSSSRPPAPSPQRSS